jgi:5'-3' exoribonuclease 1
MGIPFYFKSLVSKFPNIIARPGVKCGRVFLDFNCVIHMCAARLLAKTSSPLNQNKINFKEQVIDDSLEYIHTILKATNPTSLLYIAVDGTCPRAKMQQQRKRRFMSNWRTEKLSEGSNEKQEIIWDSNIVTPGTSFMIDFDQKLHAYVADLKKKCAFDVMCSPSADFGEGEHKIFEYIENNKIAPDIVDVIYGLDADLIMLSMLRSERIFLLRELPEFNIKNTYNDAFLVLNVGLLKEILVGELLNKDPERVQDYVILCCLIGNDFIPPLGFLKIKTDGIEVLLRIYNKLGNRIIVDNELNIAAVMSIFQELSIIEDGCMQDADVAYYSRKCQYMHTIENRIDNYPTLNKHPRNIDVHTKQWRMSYYKHMFHYNIDDVVNDACEKYIEGLLWMFEYYIKRRHNCGWYYPYHYSPTCLDLYNFMIASPIEERAIKVKDTHATHSEFMEIVAKPGMHLLLVLPPSSDNLLPSAIKPILSDVALGCVQYYPRSFGITTYLKTYLWECNPILPDVSIRGVYGAYCGLRPA